MSCESSVERDVKEYLYIITKPPYASEVALSAINLAITHAMNCDCKVSILFAGDGVYCLTRNQKTGAMASIEDLLYTAVSVGISVYYVLEDAGERGVASVVEGAVALESCKLKEFLGKNMFMLVF